MMTMKSKDQALSQKTTRQHLLDTGVGIMAHFGFTGIGLSALLKEAGVPKGSFYHYFASKEQFGQAVLEHYFEQYLAEVNGLLNDNALSPVDRVLEYFARWQQQYTGQEPVQTCLVVKLSAEVADLSESMRLALKKGTEELIGRLASTLEQQADRFKAEQALNTATNLYQLWLGASLLTKLHRNQSHMLQAMQLTEDRLGLV